MAEDTEYNASEDTRLKDTKAVSETGEPLRLYHGSLQKFSHFNTEKLGSNTHSRSAKEGFFFADNPVLADTYDPTGKIADYLGVDIDKDGNISHVENEIDDEILRIILMLMACDYAISHFDKLYDQSRDMDYFEDDIDYFFDKTTASMYDGSPETPDPKDIAPFIIRRILEDYIGEDYDDDESYDDDFQSKSNIKQDVMSDLKKERESLKSDYENTFTQFRNDMENLRSFGENTEDISHLKQVHLIMNNPLIKEYPKVVDFQDAGITDTIKQAEENGNDGVIFKNLFDPGLDAAVGTIYSDQHDLYNRISYDSSLTSPVLEEIFKTFAADHYFVFNANQIIDANSGSNLNWEESGIDPDIMVKDIITRIENIHDQQKELYDEMIESVKEMEETNTAPDEHYYSLLKQRNKNADELIEQSRLLLSLRPEFKKHLPYNRDINNSISLKEIYAIKNQLDQNSSEDENGEGFHEEEFSEEEFSEEEFLNKANEFKESLKAVIRERDETEDSEKRERLNNQIQRFLDIVGASFSPEQVDIRDIDEDISLSTIRDKNLLSKSHFIFNDENDTDDISPNIEIGLLDADMLEISDDISHEEFPKLIQWQDGTETIIMDTLTGKTRKVNNPESSKEQEPSLTTLATTSTKPPKIDKVYNNMRLVIDERGRPYLEKAIPDHSFDSEVMDKSFKARRRGL